MDKIYALSTARKGSKSVIDKNIMILNGHPLFLHNLLESLQTPEIIETYISTDVPKAFELADQYGYKVIVRPDELCQDSSTHTQTIHHGLLEIESRIGHQLDILVVMLGNTINMDRNVVKQAVEMLNEDPTLDSVITVIKANHFNPVRAYVSDQQGLIKNYYPIDSQMDLSGKNSAGDVFFQNGLWILRRRAIINAMEHDKGLMPFKWFGDKIKYIEQDPRLQEIDDNYQVRLLSNHW